MANIAIIILIAAVLTGLVLFSESAPQKASAQCTERNSHVGQCTGPDGKCTIISVSPEEREGNFGPGCIDF